MLLVSTLHFFSVCICAEYIMYIIQAALWEVYYFKKHNINKILKILKLNSNISYTA